MVVMLAKESMNVIPMLTVLIDNNRCNNNVKCNNSNNIDSNGNGNIDNIKQ